MPYSFAELCRIIGAQALGRAAEAAAQRIDWLLTDSRSLAFPETTLFFALRTERGDGARFIPDLYRRGVRHFVVQSATDELLAQCPDAAFLLVGNVLAALQQIAAHHRSRFSCPVVGITGSNGKTVVKEWLFQLLSPALNVVRSPRSYNSQIGVPLSIWLLNERADVALIEAGISEPGEMARLQPIVRPTIGILTNIGAAHQENFASLEEKCREKLRLMADADVLIYDADDAIAARCVAEARLHATLLPWSRTDARCPLFISHTEQREADTRIAYIYKGATHALTIPFTSEAAVQNAVHCLAACLVLGLTPDVVAQRAERLEPVAMRLEVKQGVRGCTLINDAYNSDLNSLDIALDFMSRRPDQAGMRKTLVLSDIQQSGMDDGELYSRVADMAAQRGIAHIVGIGPHIAAAAHCFPPSAHFFPTTDALLADGLLQRLSHEMILLKGARDFNFETLSELLSLKVHETTLEVNLEALAANFNHYRSMLRPDTKLVCMIKADAYGAGSVEIAKTLQDRGADYLAVAVADEGAELRRAGITAGIIVMNPEMSSFHMLFEYDLEPEVYSFRLLEALSAAARKEGIAHFPVHIKLDTGMHRLGFHPVDDIGALIARLQADATLIPRSVFSHFVGSDSAEFDAFSSEQFRLFDAASRQLQAAFPHRILRHICNSAGIERFADRQLDMCRLGLGLYGIDPIDNRTLNTVSTLRTTILQIRDVPAGDTVGYSRRGRIARPSRIAALPIGYADGLNRHLGNGAAYCLVGGQRAPYVGNICMDVCMVDVTDIPCHEGDAVEIFGPNLPVTVLSDVLHTIPYEILTAVSTRVKRVYYQQ